MYQLTSEVGKRVRSTSLYHSRQCSKSRLDGTDYTVLCIMTHDCSRKLWKQYTNASWVPFKYKIILTLRGFIENGSRVDKEAEKERSDA